MRSVDRRKSPKEITFNSLHPLPVFTRTNFLDDIVRSQYTYISHPLDPAMLHMQ
jgi:hypothetical protein